MKIRNGFVSNSSSSSFLISMPKSEKSMNTLEELKEYFDLMEFDNEKTINLAKESIENGLGVMEIDIGYDCYEMKEFLIDNFGVTILYDFH